MRRRIRPQEPTPEFMISPMIDMMFLLLIFFIVSTMYMSDIKTIPIRLPVAKHAQHVSKSNFSVTIKADGSIFLDDKQISKELLITNAAIESKRDAGFSVIIRADATADYKMVIELLDGLKGAGVSRFGLATEMGEGK